VLEEEFVRRNGKPPLGLPISLLGARPIVEIVLVFFDSRIREGIHLFPEEEVVLMIGTPIAFSEGVRMPDKPVLTVTVLLSLIVLLMLPTEELQSTKVIEFLLGSVFRRLKIVEGIRWDKFGLKDSN